MSYSLYLWHWPVIVFSAALLPQSPVVVAASVTLTFALAAAAYFLLERPIHLADFRPLGLAMPLAGAAIGLVLGLTAAVQALARTTDPAVAQLVEQAHADLGPNYSVGCHLDYDVITQPPCIFGKAGGRRAVLFGDSHAAQWFTAVERAAAARGFQLEARTKTSCPAADLTIWYQPLRAPYDACRAWYLDRMSELLRDPPEVVIVANSSRYYGWLLDPSSGRRAEGTEATIWAEATASTIRQLRAAGSEVLWVRDTPEMYASLMDCLASGAWSACGRPVADATAGLVLPASAGGDLRIIDPTAALCNANECPATADHRIIYRDRHHLTATFAATLSPLFAQALASIP